jgi:hypothetical protein
LSLDGLDGLLPARKPLSPEVSRGERPGVLEAAGEEGKSFLSKTAQSLVKWACMRAVDLIAPGVGAAITALDRIVAAAKAAKAAATGSGDIGFPIATIDGFEVMAEVHIGDDPDGRSLPFSAFIAPVNGDSLFDQIEITSDSHHRYAVMINANLSRLSDLPEPATRAGVFRSYAEQEVLPRLRRYHHEEVELVYVHDEAAGVGAWMHVRSGRSSWCIIVWRSQASSEVP